jgi:hypothetical protein
MDSTPTIERGPSASRPAPCEPRWAIRRPTVAVLDIARECHDERRSGGFPERTDHYSVDDILMQDAS